jgi:predicted nucleic acid-binding protein
MGLVLLDSSFLIALANSDDQHHLRAVATYKPEHRYTISAITVTEVMAGATTAKSEEETWNQLNRFIAQIHPVDGETARLAARTRLTKGLKTPDAIISATAIVQQAELWTFDGQLAKATPGAHHLR